MLNVYTRGLLSLTHQFATIFFYRAFKCICQRKRGKKCRVREKGREAERRR